MIVAMSLGTRRSIKDWIRRPLPRAVESTPDLTPTFAENRKIVARKMLGFLLENAENPDHRQRIANPGIAKKKNDANIVSVRDNVTNS